MITCSAQLTNQSQRLVQPPFRSIRKARSSHARYFKHVQVHASSLIRVGVASHHPGAAAYVTRRARDVTVRATPFLQSTGVSGKSGIVFLAGATGLVSIRLLRELATEGFKVVAGVPDEGEAAIIKDFFTRFELISKNSCENILLKEAPVGNTEATAAVIPKGARVVIVDTDGIGKAKTDAKGVSSVVSAAVAAGASQIILLTPLQGETGTSFFLFGQPSASSKASDRLSRLEQLVVDSGLAYTIVRVAGLASVKEPAATNSLLVGAAGTYPPASAPVPRDLIGEVLMTVLTQSSVGSVLEVIPNTEATEAAPLAEQVTQAVSSYRAAIADVVKEAELKQAAAQAARPAGRGNQTIKEEPEEPAAKPAPKPLFSFGGPRKAPEQEEEPASEPEPQAPKKAPAPLFAFGAKKPAPAKVEEEEKAAPPPPPKPAPFFAFGAPKAKPAPEEEAEEEVPPPKKAAPLFAFGAPKAKAAPAKEEVEEEAPKKAAPFFAFGAPKAKAAPAKEEIEEEAPKKAAPFFAFGAPKAKAAPAEEAVEEEAPKKAAPFFAFGTKKVVKEDAPVPAGKTGRAPAKAPPVKAGRGTQVQKAGTQVQKAGTQVQKARPGTQAQGAGTQRGSQKLQKPAPAPKKAAPPPKKQPPPPPAKKTPPPRRGQKATSSDEEDEPPKKGGFRLFPL